MGLNQNHIVEELGGVRCAIVEKNIKLDRVNFLTSLLSGNGFTVVCVEAEAPKPKTKPAAAANPDASALEAVAPAIVEPIAAPKPEDLMYTLGVTDVKFNPINAIYGRILTSENGNFVTPDYWHQKTQVNNDQIPYYQK
ncbi:MAG: hypothetical protein KA981_05120 [Bacteroidia bacterium]|nr:hypothetical protein [Bacteroidia bacterium]